MSAHTQMTIAEMRNALLGGSVTPQDLVHAHINRIKETEEINL